MVWPLGQSICVFVLLWQNPYVLDNLPRKEVRLAPPLLTSAHLWDPGWQHIAELHLEEIAWQAKGQENSHGCTHLWCQHMGDGGRVRNSRSTLATKSLKSTKTTWGKEKARDWSKGSFTAYVTMHNKTCVSPLGKSSWHNYLPPELQVSTNSTPPCCAYSTESLRTALPSIAKP